MSVAEWIYVTASFSIVVYVLGGIMSAISDFAAKQTAHNQKVSSDLDSINAGIDKLNALIAQLQSSSGAITPEDQATLDSIEAAGKDLEAKADAAAARTPPAVPQG